MTKITIDMHTFKALASDTRLDILKTLDGKKMSLNDICRATNLNKATLHEHLSKLYEAGLVKKNEREGHKWVYYKLSWKGEGLLHPENTKIVVLFSVTFISLLLGVMLLVNFAQPIILGMAETYGDTTQIYEAENQGIFLISRNYEYKYLGEIDAKDKTVGNITTELQDKAQIKNSVGDIYDNDEIQWVTPSNQQIGNDQFILLDIICLTNGSTDGSEYFRNNSLNETGDFNNTDEYNTTADEGNKLLGGSFGFSPNVPEMIATVQDPILLYSAIFFITFFAVAFTFSSWRFLKNKKPRL
jgi:DNA-binding transcriptional ArsR family regulator